jgi:hypothetical protein
VVVENGAVSVSVIGTIFVTNHEAAAFNAVFYEHFETTGWEYYDTNGEGEDMYVKDGVYACIAIPSKRDDGYIATAIAFSRTIANF